MAEEQLNPISIVVIDSSDSTLSIYDVPDSWLTEDIEAWLSTKHHLSNCAWGVFDGTINDERPE